MFGHQTVIIDVRGGAPGVLEGGAIKHGVSRGTAFSRSMSKAKQTNERSESSPLETGIQRAKPFVEGAKRPNKRAKRAMNEVKHFTSTKGESYLSIKGTFIIIVRLTRKDYVPNEEFGWGIYLRGQSTA